MDEAGLLPDLARRAELLRDAETILVRDEVPIAPVYFFSGFNYYNPKRVSGVYGNLLDLHPINAIRRTGRGPRVESREPERAEHPEVVGWMEVRRRLSLSPSEGGMCLARVTRATYSFREIPSENA